MPVIDKVFVNDGDGQHILAYWQHLARTTSVTEKFRAKTLTGKLMATPMTDNGDLAAQIIKLTGEIDELDSEIAAKEEDLNQISCDLYGLTPDERQIVGRG